MESSRLDAPMLSCQDITKTYKSNLVTACDRISLELQAGEIHCILGENGAGKSTLMRILTGDQQPDEGDLLIRGEKAVFTSPHDALVKGIGMIHQQSNSIPELSVWENIVLGAEGLPVIGRLSLNAPVRKLIDGVCSRYGFSLPLKKRASKLDSNAIQTAALISLLIRRVQVLVFDEPHLHFTGIKPIDFSELAQRLAEEGYAIAVVTHNLSTAFQIASRITILFKGKSMGTFSRHELTLPQATRLMMGESSSPSGETAPKADRPTHYAAEKQAALLTLEGVSTGSEGDDPSALKQVSFSVYPGEVLACVGIQEHGLRTLEQVLTSYRPGTAGAHFPVSEGVIRFSGLPEGIPGLKELRKHRVGYVPSNRLVSAAAVESTLEDNAILHIHPRLTRDKAVRFIDKHLSREYAQMLIRKFSIQGKPEDLMISLSGGNIQKLVTARELALNPKLLIACEIAWGLDVMTQDYLFEILKELKEAGCGILLITSESDLALRYSDRIAMFHRGNIVHTASTASVSSSDVGKAILEGKTSW